MQQNTRHCDGRSSRSINSRGSSGGGVVETEMPKLEAQSRAETPQVGQRLNRGHRMANPTQEKERERLDNNSREKRRLGAGREQTNSSEQHCRSSPSPSNL